jgi:hypothetical protein
MGLSHPRATPLGPSQRQGFRRWNTQYLITGRGLAMLREGLETNPPGGGQGKEHGC